MASQFEKDDCNDDSVAQTPCLASQSIDWYHEGESRIVDIGGVQITVRFIGRRGRRGRIAITAPRGAVFLDLDRVDRASPEDDCSNA